MKRTILLVAAATTLIGTNGCQTLGAGHHTEAGAGIGAVAGGLVGGLWGAARGNWKEGALIGAGVGAAVGGVSGAVIDHQREDMRKAGIAEQTDQAGNIIVNLASGSLNFATGSAVIPDSGQQNLMRLAGVLAKYPENRIAIYGFTDNVGDPASNRLLSQQRADAVKLFLLTNGVPQHCILGAVGYGEDYPAASNDTAEGRAENRRVVLRISVDQAEAKKDEAARERWQSGD